ncbi:protein FAM185A [Podarcis muralis]
METDSPLPSPALRASYWAAARLHPVLREAGRHPPPPAAHGPKLPREAPLSFPGLVVRPSCSFIAPTSAGNHNSQQPPRRHWTGQSLLGQLTGSALVVLKLTGWVWLGCCVPEGPPEAASRQCRMRPLPPRGWCAAARTVAGSWHRLLKGGGVPGRRSWAGSCQQPRWFAASPCRCSKSEASKRKGSKPLKEWTLVVGPYGLLKARLPCHVSVHPLDPHKYPQADRVFVTVRGATAGPAQGADLDSLHVKYDEVRKEITIISEDMDGAASVDVRTPIKFDLDIKTTGNGCVKTEKIECNSCRIETEKGTSILRSIKSQKIDIQAKGGKVICLGTLQGNADIHVSQESSVNIEKLQGSSIHISTKNGLLKAKYLYAESSLLSSTAGDILLGNVHGDTTLETKTGNITVDSSEGFLKVSTHHGEIDVYIINQKGEVDLKSQEGSITVKVPATLQAYLQLSGSKVEVSPDIQLQETQNAFREDCITVTGHMNQQDKQGKYIKAETENGTVHLKSQTWFQSVKLKAS